MTAFNKTGSNMTGPNMTESDMTESSGELPEIESFNMSELDVSGLDTRLELTTLLPRIVTPDCGPTYYCSCYGHCTDAPCSEGPK
jgi:hypothetical protein